MKSAILDKGRIITKEKAMPEVTQGKVLVKVDSCCICGTDLKKYKAGHSTEEWGHEILGTLVGNGKKVTIRTSYPCGKCDFCKEGKPSLCRTWKRNCFSGFSEYISVDSDCVIPLSEKEQSSTYILMEPLNVAINLVKRSEANDRDKIAVIGNAAIGLMAALYLKKSFNCDVAVFSRNKSQTRGEFCRKNSINCFSMEQIKEKLQEYNKIICTAPYEIVPMLVENAAAHSDIVINGISDNSKNLIDLSLIHFHNLSIRGCFPHPQDEFEAARKFIGENLESMEMIITHRVPLHKIEEAFLIACHEGKEYIKIVVDM